MLTQNTLSEKIRSLYTQIVELESLQPGPKVNRLFGDLVTTVVNNSYEPITLTKTQTTKIQQLCGYAEFLLEQHWVEKMLKEKDINKALASFPYFGNYEDLTQLEWFTLRGLSKNKLENTIFVGGGPLPLSAILLAKYYGQQVTILDIDKKAIELSRILINRLGLSKLITIIHCDGQTFKEYVDYSVIFIAALAGLDTKIKTTILNEVHKQAKPDTYIITRSSWGMRKLLYKPLSKHLIKKFKTLVELHPHNHVVNSVIILQK